MSADALEGLVVDEKTGLWHRPGTTHLAMIREARRAWVSARPLGTDVVLDLGANVGGYAAWAASCGARMVVAYEAAPDTCAVLAENLRAWPQAFWVQAAVVAELPPDECVEFYLSRRHHTRGMANASVVPWRGRTPVRVPAASFARVVNDLRPTILKIDVEGAELAYPLLDEEVMSSVRVLACEVHVRDEARHLGLLAEGQDGRDFGRRLIERIEERYELVGGDPCVARRPLDFGSRWGVNGVWVRKQAGTRT